MIEFNKVTWYSKAAALILAVIVGYLGFRIGVEYAQLPEASPTGPRGAPAETVRRFDSLTCEGGAGVLVAHSRKGVTLSLPDGRIMFLPRVGTESGGEQYMSADGAIIFSLGEEAFFRENGRVKYGGCVPQTAEASP